FAPRAVGDAFGDIVTDPAITRLTAAAPDHHGFTRFGLHRLGNDDEREIAPSGFQHLDLLGDACDAIGDFGNEDYIRPTGDSCRKSYMPGIAPHHLHNHDPAVARC